jgi:hypothetical protein
MAIRAVVVDALGRISAEGVGAADGNSRRPARRARPGDRGSRDSRPWARPATPDIVRSDHSPDVRRIAEVARPVQEAPMRNWNREPRTSGTRYHTRRSRPGPRAAGGADRLHYRRTAKTCWRNGSPRSRSIAASGHTRTLLPAERPTTIRPTGRVMDELSVPETYSGAKSIRFARWWRVVRRAKQAKAPLRSGRALRVGKPHDRDAARGIGLVQPHPHRTAWERCEPRRTCWATNGAPGPFVSRTRPR